MLFNVSVRVSTGTYLKGRCNSKVWRKLHFWNKCLTPNLLIVTGSTFTALFNSLLRAFSNCFNTRLLFHGSFAASATAFPSFIAFFVFLISWSPTRATTKLIQQIFFIRRIFIALSTTYAMILPISPTYDCSGTIDKIFFGCTNRNPRNQNRFPFWKIAQYISKIDQKCAKEIKKNGKSPTEKMVPKEPKMGQKT